LALSLTHKDKTGPIKGKSRSVFAAKLQYWLQEKILDLDPMGLTA
jgi:hypothetical protein